MAYIRGLTVYKVQVLNNLPAICQYWNNGANIQSSRHLRISNEWNECAVNMNTDFFNSLKSSDAYMGR